MLGGGLCVCINELGCFVLQRGVGCELWRADECKLWRVWGGGGEMSRDGGMLAVVRWSCKLWRGGTVSCGEVGVWELWGVCTVQRWRGWGW